MKYLQFYKDRIPGLPDPNQKGESVVPCIFHEHESDNLSLAVNVESGKWKCYAPHCPGHKGGGYKAFDKLLKGEVAGTDIRAAPIEPGVIEGFHHILLQNRGALDILHTKRGYTDATIKRFQLGWDGDRILIPILGPDGSYVNVRKYKYGAQKDKMIAWAVGYNRARLFPIESLKSQRVILFEGETDTMLACQLGIAGAITPTGGADTWLDEFNEMLRGKDVYICYDMDEAGRQGGSRVAQKLLGIAKSVWKVRLPLAGSKDEKDLTDYIVHLGHSVEDFEQCVAKAEQQIPMVESSAPPDTVEVIHFSGIGREKFVGKRIESTVLVAGKDLAPFQVPRRIGYACDQGGSEKSCDRCGVGKTEGCAREITVPEWSNDLLQMVNVPIEKLHSHLGRIAGVPHGCSKWKFEVKDYANIESVKAIPEIDFSADSAPYVIRLLYFLGHGIETNRTYRVRAVVMPDPKTQSATALIYEAVPSQTSIEKFDVTPEVIHQLRIFQT